MQLAIGARKEAEVSYRAAITLSAKLPDEKRRSALSAYRRLAGFYLAKERLAEAGSVLKTGLAEAERRARGWDWLPVLFTEELGWVFCLQNRYDEAQQLATAAVDHYQQKDQDQFLNAAQAHILLAR